MALYCFPDAAYACEGDFISPETSIDLVAMVILFVIPAGLISNLKNRVMPLRRFGVGALLAPVLTAGLVIVAEKLHVSGGRGALFVLPCAAMLIAVDVYTLAKHPGKPNRRTLIRFGILDALTIIAAIFALMAIQVIPNSMGC
jgi:hypothetical protein